MISPTVSAAKPKRRQSFTASAGGSGIRNWSSSPLSTSCRYSRGRSRLNSSSGVPPVKMTVSMGNFSGRKWVLKKCTTKMKLTASRASSLWMVVATFTIRPGTTRGEDLREPKEQSRAADYCHPPEYSEVVELLPIRPAPVLRARSAAQEPFQRPAELLPVAPLEQHALRAGQEVPPALAAPPPLPHQVAQVQPEIGEGQHRAEPVDQPGGLEAPQQVRQHLRPGGIGELQNHPRQRQPQKTGDHQQVQVALEGLEAAHVDAALRLAVLHLLAVLQRARQPQRHVGARDHQRTHQQRGHGPERHEQERVLLRIVVRGVRQVSGELAVRAGMALRAGFDDVVAAQMGARVVHRQNVVRAMAIVALGGLQIAQLRNLQVLRLPWRA